VIKIDKIKLIVVDDDETWLKAFLQFLTNEPDLFVVGSASNKEGVLGLVNSHDADFVLLDLNLDQKQFEGIELTKEIHAIKSIKVIVITAYENENLMIQSLLAGAIDFYPKTKFKDIPNVIRLAYKNISPVEILLREYYKLQTEIVLKDLSTAENEVFELLLQNCSLAQISAKLNKSESTIKNQVNSIFKKLDIKNRKQIHTRFSHLIK
jgi:DNA-binding NarL/FixJ family response regulator